jgi:hypothetical protein
MPDRRTLLADASPEQLTHLFRRVPALGTAVSRPGGQPVPVGGPTGSFRVVSSPRDLDELADLLGDRAIIVATCRELTLTQLQLVQLATVHGHTLTRGEVVAEAGEDAVAQLEADADVLADLLLAHRRDGWLTLLPGVSDVIDTEGADLQVGLQDTNSEVLAAVLRNLGHRNPPTRKAQRLELLLDHLRDAARLRATISQLPDEARAVLARLVEKHPASVYGLDPGYRRRYGGGGRAPAASPLQHLEDCGLVTVSPWGDQVDAWTEVIVSVRGRLFDSWPQPPALDPVPLDPSVPTVPTIVGTVDRLLALWETTPAEGLASGGIGVRAVRSAAKTLGVAPTTLATVGALAVQLEVLGTVVTDSPHRKRGSWTGGKTVWTTTTRRAAWAELHPALRWAHLVGAWPDSRMLDETDGLPDRVVKPEQGVPIRPRRRLLATLRELPDDTGVELAVLARHLALRYPFDALADDVAGLVAVLRLLGVVPDDGPIGFTSAARQLLADPHGLVEVLGAGAQTFIVQPDHTVVAPPDLQPQLLARLDAYARCESDAGARIYRLDETRLAAALDADDGSADAILAFLTEHSSRSVPATVERLIRDVAQRHGALRVGTATSYLVSQDPALLSRAVAVRPARLRALAPTVAVSTLARAKLVEVLRGRGLLPVAEGHDGAVVNLHDQRQQSPAVTAADLPQLHDDVSHEATLRQRARSLATG